MTRLLAAFCVLSLLGCASPSLAPDELLISGTIRNLKPATEEKKGPSFEFVVDEPTTSKDLVIAYELFAFSMSDTISEPQLASLVGKRVRMRVRKSDLTEAGPSTVQLRTPSSLAIHPL